MTSFYAAEIAVDRAREAAFRDGYDDALTGARPMPARLEWHTERVSYWLGFDIGREDHAAEARLVAFGALRLVNASVAEVLADGDGLRRLGGLGFGGGGEEREFVVGESNGEDFRASVARRGSAGSGGHGHEVTVSHGCDLSQYVESTFRIAQTDFMRYGKSHG